VAYGWTGGMCALGLSSRTVRGSGVAIRAWRGSRRRWCEMRWSPLTTVLRAIAGKGWPLSQSEDIFVRILGSERDAAGTSRALQRI
jgi:hypothetical protein